MGQSNDEWIARTGGFRLGESGEAFQARVGEIEGLEARLRSGSVGVEELESVQRRLRELKGIDFDADDDE